jgi:UMF1 family MFS transporter
MQAIVWRISIPPALGLETMSESRRMFSWALYDWANSAFATTVMAGFFPIFFKQFWSADVAAVESTFRLGAISSLASFIIVLLAPILGAIADQAGARKGFLLVFTCLGVLGAGGLFLVEKGFWEAALLLYLCGLIGFFGANVFYDSLLVDVAPKSRLDQVSALGFSLGYLGGGLLFAFNVLMTQQPQWFGLADAAQAVRYAFLSVAIWWALFAIPLFLFVPTRATSSRAGWAAVRGGFAQLWQTLQHVREMPNVGLFLLAYWCYIDGVDTVVIMAVDYGLSLGFASGSLMLALLITQFVGFPAALLFGRLGANIGPKKGIMVGIFVYLLVVLWASRMRVEWEFYALAVAIGLVQGGIQALSRSLYARLIPAQRSGEFFGFYNMLGKFAAILGPVTVGWVAVASGSARLSILSIAVFFILGAILLARVKPSPPLGAAAHEASV